MPEDPANVIYGRLKEAAWMYSQTKGRTAHWLESLLEGEEWRTVGPGFADVNQFLRSIDLSDVGNQPELVRRIKELQPTAEQSAIASAVGTSQPTVSRILNPPSTQPEPYSGEYEEAQQEADDLPEQPEPYSGEYEEAQTEDEGEPEPVTVPPSGDKPESAGPKPSQMVQQSTENDWHTPPRYITAAREVLGAIDLDPASSTAANTTIGALKFYAEHDNGLAQPWKGRVWLNPPYGRRAGEFILRLCEEHAAGNVPEAIALVNAHCTDTGWFQPLWDHVLCFTDHRIDFDAGGRSKKTGSTHGSVFAYLGPDPERFAEHFAQFGAVVRRLA